MTALPSSAINEFVRVFLQVVAKFGALEIFSAVSDVNRGRQKTSLH